MNKNKVVIIGAGIAGLSAGCYLQMNGYETEIFEMHTIPGGLCTSWKKGGYTFDGCIHSMGGLNPNYKQNGYWNELINLDQMKFHFHEELGRTVDVNGNTYTLYTDPDQLERELNQIAPEDNKFISEFIRSVKHLEQFDTQIDKPIELWSPLDFYLSQFKSAPYLSHLLKWQRSLKDATRECKSLLLRNLLNSDFFSRFPAYFLLFSLGSLHNRNAGYPIGGSLALALLMEKRYLALGGKVHYSSKVSKIIVKNNQAVGITLENGETVGDASWVISAADGHSTIYEMLDGKYINKKVDEMYQKHPRWPSAVLVSLGVNRTFENEFSQYEFQLAHPLVLDDKTRLESVPVTIYNFDPTLAGEGKTCLRSILMTDNFTYWKDLKEKDPQKYQQEKERIAGELIDILEQRLGAIKANVEVIDVCTPSTFNRFTNNWLGSIQGWEWLPGAVPETIRKDLPGLKGFYMIGQWAMPGGGVPSAQLMGRDITRIICKKDRKKFMTLKPE